VRIYQRGRVVVHRGGSPLKIAAISHGLSEVISRAIGLEVRGEVRLYRHFGGGRVPLGARPEGNCRPATPVREFRNGTTSMG
jgi:hypothetical protein